MKFEIYFEEEHLEVLFFINYSQEEGVLPIENDDLKVCELFP
jgi:hypothetical protein